MKVLLLAVNTARSLLKNAALKTGFAVDRLMLRVPFEMCIHKDTIHSVVSARLVGENRWRLQEIEAPCLAMCRLHFCANAHKSLDTQVRTLRKSCVDYVCSMAADNIPDRTGRIADDNLGSTRQLLSFELAVDIAVPRWLAIWLMLTTCIGPVCSTGVAVAGAASGSPPLWSF